MELILDTSRHMDNVPSCHMWLDKFLAMVDFDVLKGLVWFCASCKMGLPTANHFKKGSSHSNHLCLQTHNIGGAVCVSKFDLERLKVNIKKIQLIPGPVSTNADPNLQLQSYVYVKNTHGFFQDVIGTQEATSKSDAVTLSCADRRSSCVSCSNQIQHPGEGTNFCSLECKLVTSGFPNRHRTARIGDQRASHHTLDYPSTICPDDALNAYSQRVEPDSQQQPQLEVERPRDAIGKLSDRNSNRSCTSKAVVQYAGTCSSLFSTRFSTISETTVDGKHRIQPIPDERSRKLHALSDGNRPPPPIHKVAKPIDSGLIDPEYMFSRDHSNSNERNTAVHGETSGLNEEESFTFPVAARGDASTSNEVYEQQNHAPCARRRALNASMNAPSARSCEFKWAVPYESDASAGDVVPSEPTCKVVPLHEVKLPGRSQISYIGKNMPDKPRKYLYLDKKTGEAFIINESEEPRKDANTAAAAAAVRTSVLKRKDCARQTEFEAAQRRVKAFPDCWSGVARQCGHATFPHRAGVNLPVKQQRFLDPSSAVTDEHLKDAATFSIGSSSRRGSVLSGSEDMDQPFLLQMRALREAREVKDMTCVGSNSAARATESDKLDAPCVEFTAQVPLLDRPFLPFCYTSGEWPLISNNTVFDGLRLENWPPHCSPTSL